MKNIHRYFILLVLGTCLSAGADESVRLDMSSQKLSGRPSAALVLELTVETTRVLPVKLKLPAEAALVIRKVETLPIRRTERGVYRQGRRVIWQGVTCGSITIPNITVDVEGTLYVFPPVEILITDVPMALPPSEVAP